MNPRFQPDPDANPAEAVLIDPEAYDASEQQFATSLEQTSPRFVVKQECDLALAPATAIQPTVDSSERSEPETLARPVEPNARSRMEEALPQSQPQIAAAAHSMRPDGFLQADHVPAPNLQTADLQTNDAHAWRNEVTARLDRYRSRRRPREPRYPSLRLKFEAAEPAWSSPPARPEPASPPQAEKPRSLEPEPNAPQFIASANTAEPTARVIPFRRPAVAPPRPLEELADPVLPLAPRILEAPEVTPPPPALGGILIEPAVEEVVEKRPGIEVPLQPAAMSRRLLAVGVDALLVVVALALFAYVFFRTTAIIPAFRQIGPIALALGGAMWLAYQYALLVYCGSTPGLGLARLKLSRFDGSAVPRRLRHWRVLATALSGVSLGLGYAWCILDEDQLCWHDRITRTYMAPRS